MSNKPNWKSKSRFSLDKGRIAEKILSKGGHYLLAVKENQGGLLYEVKDVMRYSEPTSVHTETEKEHALVETRTVSIFPAARMEDKEVLSRWPGIRTLVRIETATVYVSGDGKEERQTRYHISDEDFPSAAYYGSPAGGHWAVENGLH